MQGRIIKSTGKWYDVELESGAVVKCRIKGKFRLHEFKTTNPVAVGDLVKIEMEENGQAGAINELLLRQNYIVRQSPRQKHNKHIVAANIDQALLVITLKNPRTPLGFIDRFLLTTEVYGIPAKIIINKADLYKEKDRKKLNHLRQMYKGIGYEVVIASAITGENLQEVKDMLQSRISLISGQSGVGKSTLVNAIQPGLELATGDLSDYSGKGTHTTTFAEMHKLSFGGYIIDTPGVKEFGIADLQPEELGHYFPDIRAEMDDCKFNNCLHINEPGCAVKKAVAENKIAESRYLNYLQIMDDLKQRNFWE